MQQDIYKATYALAAAGFMIPFFPPPPFARIHKYTHKTSINTLFVDRRNEGI